MPIIAKNFLKKIRFNQGGLKVFFFHVFCFFFLKKENIKNNYRYLSETLNQVQGDAYHLVAYIQRISKYVFQPRNYLTGYRHIESSINQNLLTMNSINLPVQQIQNRIFSIRGVQVMIDSDLAELYNLPVKRLNVQVKRNLSRFSEIIRLQLTEEVIFKLVANCDRFET